MTSFSSFEQLALSLPEVTIEPHFEKLSWRVQKKIFATYDDKTQRVTVKLSIEDQNSFSSLYAGIYPVKNKWGKQGWTILELDELSPDLMKRIITSAYIIVAPKKLADQIQL